MSHSKRLDFQKRAKNIIPGWTQLLSKRPDQFSEGVWPAYFDKAEGTQVWDVDGNEYTDMSISGIGANVLGYNDPDVSKAVVDAIHSGSSCSLNSYEEVELAELLCELHPWANRARFTRCGGESMAVAVRIARAATGKNKVAFCGYHGWHDWYLAANISSHDQLNDHLLQGLEPAGIPKQLAGTAIPFRFNDGDNLTEIARDHGDDLAAIVLEPIRYSGPTETFKDILNTIRKQTGAAIIIDEISAGFRLNSGGAHLTLGYDPDIAVFSKAIGNGHPIGAIIGKDDVMDAAKKCFISSTYWTERVGFVAALATIKKHKKHDVGSHLVSVGTLVQEGWKKAAEKSGLDISVSGIPPLSHFSFNEENPLAIKALFIQEMLKHGFLASNVFYPMFAHKESHVNRYLDAVNNVFKSIKISLDNNTVMQELEGQPSNAGFLRLNS